MAYGEFLSWALPSGAFLTLIGLIMKNNGEVQNKIDDLNKHVNHEVELLGNKVDSKFVTKELCNILHEQTIKNHEQIVAAMNEMKQDIKELLRMNGNK